MALFYDVPPDQRRFRIASLVLVTLCILIVGPAFADDTQILIVHTYESGRDETYAVDRAIRQAIQSKLGYHLEIFSEFLDTRRFPRPGDQTAAYLRERFSGRHLDLIIAVGSTALRFLTQRRGSLFSNSPLMFVTNKEEVDRDRPPPEISGVVTQFDPSITVKLALQLQPDARRIVVVFGTNDQERPLADLTRSRLNIFAKQFDIRYWLGLPSAEIIRDASNLPDKTFVLYLSAGRPLAASNLIRRLASTASAPIYTHFDDYVGFGVVGGNVTTYEDIGRQTGELAVRILTQHVTNVRLVPTLTDIVDWRQLQRWGLKKANLPPGTIVRFRKPSLWEEHKWLVMGAVAVLIVQSILIAALIVQGRRRQRSQLMLEQQQQELTHLGRVATLGELSGAIAHEINNPLAAILSNAQAAARFLARTPIDTDELGEILRDIAAESKRAGEVIQRLRALFRRADLHLEPVNLNGIVADVLELANRKLLEGNVTVAAKLANDVPPVRADPVQLKQVLLNIVINACDAMEESKADDRSLTIATSYDQGMAQVSVRDRGSGIDASVKERLFQPFVTTKASGTGLGLSICRSIIEALGGRLWASNNPDRGATFFVALPVASG
jgi:signal transduction histidine kinase